MLTKSLMYSLIKDIIMLKHWQTMEFKENWRDTVLLPSVRNKSCSSVLDSLQLTNLIFGSPYKTIKKSTNNNVILRSQKHVN